MCSKRLHAGNLLDGLAFEWFEVWSVRSVKTLYRTKHLVLEYKDREMKSAIFATLFALLLPFASAHEFSAKTVHIDHPWVKPTTVASAPGLIYFGLSNRGEMDDVLLRVEIDPKIAASAMLRRVVTDAGQVHLSYLAEGVIVPAKGAPEEGYYVELDGVTEALTEGRRFPITLIFEHGGRVEVEVVVETGPEPDQHSEAAAYEGHGVGHGS